VFFVALAPLAAASALPAAIAQALDLSIYSGEPAEALLRFLRGKRMLLIALITLAVLLIVGSLLWRSESPASSTRRMLPANKKQTLTYVALGDSTVSGVGASSSERNYVSQLAARLQSVYPEVQLSNLGVAGATSADVVARQLGQAVAADPDLVTLSIGPNDIVQGKDAQQYERNLDTLLRTLTQQTDAVVVINLLPDLGIAPRFPAELKPAIEQQTQRFNQALAHVAQAYDAQLVDLYTPSQQEIPQHPEQVSADNYHPSDAGYARWAELMWSGVATRIA
jgi:acyl-CoA thioesterase I